MSSPVTIGLFHPHFVSIRVWKVYLLIVFYVKICSSEKYLFVFILEPIISFVASVSGLLILDCPFDFFSNIYLSGSSCKRGFLIDMKNMHFVEDHPRNVHESFALKWSMVSKHFCIRPYIKGLSFSVSQHFFNIWMNAFSLTQIEQL